jgi:putative membrane protein
VTPGGMGTPSRPRRGAAVLCLVAGLAFTAWLVVHFGAGVVGEAIGAAGIAGLAAISGVRLAAAALMALAWWNLQRTGRWRIYLWARLLRDAGSDVLPLSAVGGSLLGLRAVTLHGAGAAAAVAGLVVDMTVEFCAQIAYIALALVLLTRLSTGVALVAPIGIVLCAGVAAAIGFVAAQRGRVPGFARPWLGGVLAAASAAQSEIRRLHRSRRRLGVAFLLHLCAWLLTGIEAWLALEFMGAEVGLPVALTIEGLLYAVRGVAFMVPGALGVQEGAYVAIGAALGLTPELALGLSLLKRGRDLVLGVPALVAWQLVESGRATRRRDSRADGIAPAANRR